MGNLISNNVTVRAPGKLMLMGEHAVVYGYPCLVTAVNQYITVRAGISNNTTDNFSVSNSDDRFIKAALSVFRHKFLINNKVRLTTESDIGRYGLGSSAAVTVATLKALSQLFEKSIGNKELFNLSYKVVLNIQKIASGFDLAASIYGGTILFDGKTKHIDQLTTEKLPLIVAFSGVKADTVRMVEKVEKSRVSREGRIKTDKVFSDIAVLVQKGRNAIKKRNWKNLGELFNENQKLLVNLGVNTPKIDKIVKAALNADAYGAKLSGAGGGDCIIVLVPQDKKIVVERVLVKAGAEVLDLKTGVKGVQTINF